MMYPLVDDLAAEGIAAVTTCRVLGFATQAFYKRRAQPYSDSEWDDAHLLNALVDLHADDPEFGYRLLHDELRAAGHGVGANPRVPQLVGTHDGSFGWIVPGSGVVGLAEGAESVGARL